MRKLLLIILILFAIFVVFAAISLRKTPPAPQLSGRVVLEKSGDWESIPFGNGECAVVNNMWNKGAAGKGYEQSVMIEDVGGKQTLAWRWRVPFSFPPTIVAQPEIICGNKPWDPETRPKDKFPFAVGSRRLIVQYNANLRAQGSYNMAFTLWGVSALPAVKSNISHEIMIWTDRKFLYPAGKRVDTINSNGTSFDVYIEPNQRDASGQNSNTWTYVAFVPKQPVLHGPFDVTALIDYLQRRGTITTKHYLTSLELGDEVGPGAGVTEIQDFAIEAQ